MPDATLTESFCERCGTRYEFAAPEKLTPIRKTRGLISGLKNYILSQDSLSDAVGDAMRSEEEVLASRQLDAFHSTFSFCIDCRQYTCTNCWNDEAGRCQSCHPLPQVEGLARQFEMTLGQVQSDLDMPFGLAPALNGDVAWPSTDLTEAPTVPLLAGPEPEPVLAVVEPEPEPILAAVEHELVFEAEPEPILEQEPEPVLAAVEPEPEPEPVLAAVEPEPEPEPVLAVVEPEPEPILAAVEPEPVFEAEPEPYRPLRPISDTFVHYPRSVPETDGVAAAADRETLAARRAQLDLLGLGDPGQGPVAPTRPVVLPYRSSGAVPSDAERLVAATAGVAFWDASAREVAGALSQVGVRSCGHCELSLSASARFCRRCGTPQAQSA